MNTEKQDSKIWPGTRQFVDEVEWILLRAIQRRAAQDAADELIASGDLDRLMKEDEQ